MKKNKWITLLIAAILTVVVAITVTGCTPEPDPEDPGTTQEIKSVVALKASLLSMSGFTEELTVEGAKYDFKEQAIVVSLINNLCSGILASPMSQAKIDALATTDFEGMEGPQDLLSLNLTEDDFVIIATAFYNAALTTFNNPALFDAAETAAQAYLDSLSTETRAIYDSYAEYYAVLEQLDVLQQYTDFFTEEDIDAAVALLTSVGLEPSEAFTNPDNSFGTKFYEGLYLVVEDTLYAAEEDIEVSVAEQEARNALSSLALRFYKDNSDFGSFTDWVNIRTDNLNTNADTLTWLNNWLDAVKVHVPDTTITIPTDAAGITDAWITSVSNELETIVYDLNTIANPHRNYAKVAYHAQGIELGFEQSILSNEVLSPKVQALFPELPIFMYRAMSLLENEMLTGLFSDKAGSNPLSDMDPSQLVAVIDSINSTLTDLKAFLQTNSVDLLALQGAIETLIQDEDFHLVAERFLPFYEGIGAIVSAGPNTIDFLQTIIPILNSENITGIFDALLTPTPVPLDPEAPTSEEETAMANALALQMNAGIYIAKVIDAVYLAYQGASDFSEALSTIVLDDLSGFAQLRALEAVGNTFSEMLPAEPESISPEMMSNYEIFTDAKEIALEARWENDPAAIEGFYTDLQDILPEGAITATITDFASAEVDAYFAELDTYLTDLMEEETSGVRVALNNLITEALSNSPYALFVDESVQALAACTPVVSAEDDNYATLRTALTDFVNILVNAGLFNEGENVMPPLDYQGENTIENFMKPFMAGVSEGILDDGLNLESVETILSETAPYNYVASLIEERTIVKIVANMTGRLTFTFSAGNITYLSVYNPSYNEEGVSWIEGAPSINVYAGMTYYLEFSTDADGELSMEIAEHSYQPAE